MPKPEQRKQRLSPPAEHIILIALLCLGVFLCLYGSVWGLPDRLHFHHSFHPDEHASLVSSLSILSGRPPLHPSAFAMINGALHYYLLAAVYKTADLVGLADLDSPTLSSDGLARLYLVGRYVSVVVFVLSLYLVYRLTKKYLGVHAGLLATGLLSIIPASIVNAHYFRTDIPATLWILLCFLMAARLAKFKQTSNYVLAGLFAGLATATKYNSAVLLVPILVAHFQSIGPHVNFRSIFTRRLFYAGGAFVLAFVIATPNMILYFSDFRAGLAKQFWYQTANTFVESIDLGPGIINYVTRVMSYGMGWPMLALSMLAIIYSAYKHTKFDILVLSWIIPYYLVMSRSDWWVVRYTIPLMPFMAILSARLLIALAKDKRTALSLSTKTLAALVITVTFLYTLALDRIMAASDPRIRAYDWIGTHLAPGTKIGLDLLPQASYVMADHQIYQVGNMNLDVDMLPLVDYYVANDQIYPAYLRLGYRFPKQSRYFRSIFTSGRFVRVAEFENQLRILGVKLDKGKPPHDFLYFQPTITIWRRIR